MRSVTTAALLTAMLAGSAFAQRAPEPETEFGNRVKSAMEADIRTDDERERDRNRKPIRTLEFFGLEPGMQVLELFPGGGWYTKLLAPALAEDGQLHVAIGTSRLKPRLEEWGLDVEVVDDKAELEPTDQYGVFTMSNLELPNRKYDAVLTFRNYHNFTPEARAALNKEVFDSLKRGGIYAVVDHTRRHMEPTGPENWRRADPVEAIKEILDAGFELADYSDLHFRPDDPLLYDTARPSVDGYSDRFTLKFVKP